VVQGPWTIESCLPRHNTFLLLQISSPHIPVCLASQQRPATSHLTGQILDKFCSTLAIRILFLVKEGGNDIHAVSAFAAVAKHLNVTKAANMLHVSQPSLSKHLKALEENFRLRLFTRHPKGIRLTDEGYEFFHDIEPILAQLEKINQRYRNGTASKHSGPLKVGGTYGPASRILPSLLGV
jgi:Bacterial regulatory helix-turn-helix protein, lysR family